MPLVVVCGLPACGKTTRARELEQALVAAGRRARVLNDEGLNVSKRTAYADANEEKKARAALMTAVERYLTAEEVVIADALNYIKGYRYQLFCVAKAHGTPHCIVECATSGENRIAWNAQRDDGYAHETMAELDMRYEAPNSMTRWDKPLFVVHTDDPLPMQEITDALFGGKAPTPNLATRATPLSDTNYLFQLDQTTQQIVNAIMEAQQMGVSRVTVGGSSKPFALNRTVNWAELHRHRRQFLNLNKISALKDATSIRDAFIEYLSTMLA